MSDQPTTHERTTMETIRSSFRAICPDCDGEWTMTLPPAALVGLANAYGHQALEGQFDKLATRPPTARCPLCTFRYAP